MITEDTRARYIEGLRTLADTLEQHEELPLPYEGHGSAISFNFLSGSDPRADLAAAARAIPCDWSKRTWEGENGNAYFEMAGKLCGVKVELTAFREAVCERIVTGTEDREVEEVVTPAVTKMVTKPVEVVEWRCHPVLAPAEDREAVPA